MKILYHYRVRIYNKPDDFLHKNEFINETVKIAAENENYIIIDDYYFSKISKKGSYSDYELNKSKIFFRTNNNILGDGLFYELYSENKKTTASIKKTLQNYIDKKIGYLTAIDLSIVK